MIYFDKMHSLYRIGVIMILSFFPFSLQQNPWELTWTWSGPGGVFPEDTNPNFNISNSPGDRLDGATYTTSTTLILAGGRKESIIYSDVWEFSVKKNLWRKRKGPITPNLPHESLIDGQFNETNYPQAKELGFFFFTKFTHTLWLSINDISEIYFWEYHCSLNQWKLSFQTPRDPSFGEVDKFEESNILGGVRHTTPFLLNDTNVIIFGGLSFPGNLRSNSVREFSLVTNQWRIRREMVTDLYIKGQETGVFNITYQPTKREYHATWGHQKSKKMFIFGGEIIFSQGALGDLWVYSYELNSWAFLGGNPEPEVVLRRRNLDVGYRRDIFTFDPTNFPKPRSGHYAVNLGDDAGLVLFFGGYYAAYDDPDPVRQFYPNTWVYSIGRNEWKQTDDISLSGRERTYAQVWSYFNETSKSTIIYLGGGFWTDDWLSTKFYNDVQKYDHFELECYNHGMGGNNGTCICDPHYGGDHCESFNCSFVEWTNTPNVCHGRGNCIEHDVCVCLDYPHVDDSNFCACENNWYGPTCKVTICDGIFSNETETVCHGRGTCSSPFACDCDTMDNVNNAQYCSCMTTWGYGENYFCNITKCGEYLSNDTLVCSSRGSCIDFNTCICDQGYDDTTFCEDYMCYGVNHKNKSHCSGKGDCKDVDKCICHDPKKDKGKKCSEEMGSAFYDKKNLLGTVDFLMEKSDFPSESPYSPKFQCDDRIVDPEAILGPFYWCYWNLNIEQTHVQSFSIVVSRESPLSVGDTFLLKLITKPNETVQLTFQDPPKVVGGVDLFWKTYQWYFVGSGILFVALLICTFLLCSTIFTALFIKNANQKKKIDKFKGIEDIDVLLLESEAAEKSPNDHAKFKINQKLFELSYEDLKITEKIGTGAYSIVFRAVWQNSVDVAFKCFKISDFTNQDRFTMFEREVSLLASIKHPFVLEFYGAVCKVPRVGIVVKFAENGDIENFLKKYKTATGFPYHFPEKIRMMKEVSSALGHVHTLNIVHRDLKCENILVMDDYSTRLMDFGLSRVVEDQGGEMTKRVGTGNFMAPELVASGNYTKKVDSFSLAIVMFCVFFDEYDPYRNSGTSNFNIERKVFADPTFRPTFPQNRKGVPRWVEDLITSNWEASPEDRMDCSEITDYLGSKFDRYDDEKSQGNDMLKKLEMENQKLKNENQELQQRLSKYE